LGWFNRWLDKFYALFAFSCFYNFKLICFLYCYSVRLSGLQTRLIKWHHTFFIKFRRSGSFEKLIKRGFGLFFITPLFSCLYAAFPNSRIFIIFNGSLFEDICITTLENMSYSDIPDIGPKDFFYTRYAWRLISTSRLFINPSKLCPILALNSLTISQLPPGFSEFMIWRDFHLYSICLVLCHTLLVTFVSALQLPSPTFLLDIAVTLSWDFVPEIIVIHLSREVVKEVDFPLVLILFRELLGSICSQRGHRLMAKIEKGCSSRVISGSAFARRWGTSVVHHLFLFDYEIIIF
jgi:hypothetical protein